MEILLIRHGQSQADLLDVHEGKADFPLTELGVRQAQLMAKYIQSQSPPEIIFSSPLKRAYETAKIVQKEVGCLFQIEEELVEYNNGVLAGLSRQVAATRYPLPKSGRPYHIPIQDGESELQFRFRTEAVFAKIIDDSRCYQRIAVIAHGGTISNIIKSFLKQPNTNEFGYYTGDTGIHLLKVTENRRLILYLNKLEHLLSLS